MWGNFFQVVKNPIAVLSFQLELYHRRQQYGKKVSQTNLIKMLEKKTIKNLEKEINNSKIYA